MIKSNFSWAVLAVITQFFLLMPVSSAAVDSAGQNLLLFYSNDVKGETEACG